MNRNLKTSNSMGCVGGRSVGSVVGAVGFGCGVEGVWVVWGGGALGRRGVGGWFKGCVCVCVCVCVCMCVCAHTHTEVV